MPHYQAITKTDFANLRWKRYDSYAFAAQDAVAPLVAQELPKACTCLPIAFLRQDEAFVPAAVLGLQPGKNLFVAPDGRWLGPYTPAAYRGYPFALAEADNNQLVLCVDTDSGLIGDQHEQPFFEADGEPAQAVKEVLNFLQQLRTNRALTVRLCAALEAEALLVPWSITLKGEQGEQAVEGLYRIDEDALKALAGDALARLHAAGALPLAYCQLISMQHLQGLGQLTDAHAKLGSQAVPENLDSLFDSGDDDFTFDFDS